MKLLRFSPAAADRKLAQYECLRFNCSAGKPCAMLINAQARKIYVWRRIREIRSNPPPDG